MKPYEKALLAVAGSVLLAAVFLGVRNAPAQTSCPSGSMVLSDGSATSCGPIPGLTIGTTTTGAGGTSASVTNTGGGPNPVLNFTIPAGTNGSNGTNGTNGSGATVAVGTVSTLAAGSSATVVNVGTPTAAILNYGIPGSAANCTNPMGTALNPSIGTGLSCSYKADSTVRLQDQHVNTTTASGGTWSVTWARTMTTSTPIVHSDQLDNSTNAGNCKIMTRSSTGATGICFSGSILTILGIQVTLLSVVSSGVAVMVSGSEATQ